MDWERQKLVLAYRPLAHKVGSQMWQRYFRFFRWMEMGDCVAEALFCLVKAANSFDDQRGVKFSTYAYRVIHNHFLDLYEQACAVRTPADVDLLSELLVYEDATLDMVELLESFAQFLTTCNEREKMLLRLLLAGRSQKECATAFVEEHVMKSCSQPAVSMMIQKVVQRFQREVLCGFLF